MNKTCPKTRFLKERHPNAAKEQIRTQALAEDGDGNQSKNALN